MSYRDVDFHGPNGDEIDVKFFTTEHRMQIGEIDSNLPVKELLNTHFRRLAVIV
jgi:hypothetical protein